MTGCSLVWQQQLPFPTSISAADWHSHNVLLLFIDPDPTLAPLVRKYFMTQWKLCCQNLNLMAAYRCFYSFRLYRQTNRKTVQARRISFPPRGVTLPAQPATFQEIQLIVVILPRLWCLFNLSFKRRKHFVEEWRKTFCGTAEELIKILKSWTEKFYFSFAGRGETTSWTSRISIQTASEADFHLNQ